MDVIYRIVSIMRVPNASDGLIEYQTEQHGYDDTAASAHETDRSIFPMKRMTFLPGLRSSIVPALPVQTRMILYNTPTPVKR